MNKYSLSLTTIPTESYLRYFLLLQSNNNHALQIAVIILIPLLSIESTFCLFSYCRCVLRRP